MSRRDWGELQTWWTLKNVEDEPRPKLVPDFRDRHKLHCAWHRFLFQVIENTLDLSL